MTPVLWFVGVCTTQSLVNEAFPLWMADLGRRVHLVGRDLPLDAPAESYRSLVTELPRTTVWWALSSRHTSGPGACGR